jgi:hypothetical protein
VSAKWRRLTHLPSEKRRLLLVVSNTGIQTSSAPVFQNHDPSIDIEFNDGFETWSAAFSCLEVLLSTFLTLEIFKVTGSSFRKLVDHMYHTVVTGVY